VEFDTERESAGAFIIKRMRKPQILLFPTLADLPSVDEIIRESHFKTTAAVCLSPKSSATIIKKPITRTIMATLPSKKKLNRI